MSMPKEDQHNNNFIDALQGLNFYIENHLAIPIWLQEKTRLSMDKSRDDFYGFGFEIDAEEFRNKVANYALENFPNRTSNDLLKKGKIVFMDYEIDFGDIKNSESDLLAMHDMVLQCCNTKERNKALAFYKDSAYRYSTQAFQAFETEMAYCHLMMGELFESSGKSENLQTASSHYNGAHQILGEEFVQFKAMRVSNQEGLSGIKPNNEFKNLKSVQLAGASTQREYHF